MSFKSGFESRERVVV